MGQKGVMLNNSNIDSPYLHINSVEGFNPSESIKSYCVRLFKVANLLLDEHYGYKRLFVGEGINHWNLGPK